MKHVNLVDLVHGSKEEVRIFETEKQLSIYTKKTKKYFPKEDARDGGVLRALRRHIFSPRDGTTSGRFEDVETVRPSSLSKAIVVPSEILSVCVRSRE